MCNECANPITGQPYDALSEAEYAAMKRREVAKAKACYPVPCYDCGRRIEWDDGCTTSDGGGWWAWRDGKLELCCRECRFTRGFGSER